jgi:hypothetical protein
VSGIGKYFIERAIILARGPGSSGSGSMPAD